MNLPKKYAKNIYSLKYFLDLLYEKYEFIDELMHKKRFIYNITFILCLVFIWFCIFFLNLKTYITGDDYVYSFVYQTQERLASISDVFESQYTHYFVWGGRSVVHVIGQLLLLIHTPIVIDIINSTVFLLFICLIYYHITAGKKNSISLFVIIFCFVWILQPVFAETVLWITGSANYLWGTIIILLFLLPYRLFKNQGQKKIMKLLSPILMLIGGIIAGWTNENTVAAMIVMVVSFIIYYRINKWEVPFWAYAGLFGAIIGYIIMISAPGNFARAEGITVNALFVAYRIVMHTGTFINYLGAFNLCVVILLILYLKFSKENKSAIIPYVIIYFIGSLISIYVMSFSPGFPPRAWFGTITFNIIAGGIVLYNLDYSLSFMRQIKNSILVFCMVAFAFSFYDAYKDVTAIDRIWKERLAIIEQKKQEGAKSVTFKEYQAGTKFGLGDAPYALKYMSDYYGIEIQLER